MANMTLTFRREHPKQRASYGVDGNSGIVVFDRALIAGDGPWPDSISLDVELVGVKADNKTAKAEAAAVKAAAKVAKAEERAAAAGVKVLAKQEKAMAALAAAQAAIEAAKNV